MGNEKVPQGRQWGIKTYQISESEYQKENSGVSARCKMGYHKSIIRIAAYQRVSLGVRGHLQTSVSQWYQKSIRRYRYCHWDISRVSEECH